MTNSYSIFSFQIVFEGEVGKNNLGDIAIDDISFAPGACPSKAKNVIRNLIRSNNLLLKLERKLLKACTKSQ